jgi:trk system potassium uptake protein TrkH
MIVVTLTTILIFLENISFLDMLFQSTSVVATVGLSSIDTSALSNISKILIIINMLVGRIGPLSFAIALTMQNAQKKIQDMVYPEGKIIVG